MVSVGSLTNTALLLFQEHLYCFPQASMHSFTLGWQETKNQPGLAIELSQIYDTCVLLAIVRAMQLYLLVCNYTSTLMLSVTTLLILPESTTHWNFHSSSPPSPVWEKSLALIILLNNILQCTAPTVFRVSWHHRQLPVPLWMLLLLFCPLSLAASFVWSAVEQD